MAEEMARATACCFLNRWKLRGNPLWGGSANWDGLCTGHGKWAGRQPPGSGVPPAMHCRPFLARGNRQTSDIRQFRGSTSPPTE